MRRVDTIELFGIPDSFFCPRCGKSTRALGLEEYDWMKLENHNGVIELEWYCENEECEDKTNYLSVVTTCQGIYEKPRFTKADDE